MSLFINAAARREAILVRQGDMGLSEIKMGQMAANLALNGDPALIQTTAARLKPRAFGHMGIVVADAVELVFAEQPAYGPYGLLCMDDDQQIRPAEEEDVANISTVTTCWETTIMHATDRIIGKPTTERQATNLAILEGHWALRKVAHGIGSNLHGLMAGAAGTAVTECLALTNGMGTYWEAHGGTNLAATLRKSHTPLVSAASLEVDQLNAFNLRYQGRRDNPRSKMFNIVFSKIDPSIYETSGQGTIIIGEAIEDLPVKRYGTVGHVPPRTPGPRIGCPIQLTPQLTQRLWRSYVDSLVAAHLIE